jgi:hypothetical protein
MTATRKDRAHRSTAYSLRSCTTMRAKRLPLPPVDQSRTEKFDTVLLPVISGSKVDLSCTNDGFTRSDRNNTRCPQGSVRSLVGQIGPVTAARGQGLVTPIAYAHTEFSKILGQGLSLSPVRYRLRPISQALDDGVFAIHAVVGYPAGGSLPPPLLAPGHSRRRSLSISFAGRRREHSLERTGQS